MKKESNFQKIFNLRKSNNIYVTNFGDHKPLFISEGNSPQFHLDESWISFFNSYKKIITFQNLDTNEMVLKVKISNKINPYFFPEKAMLNNKSIIYTDINSKGIPRPHPI